VRPCGRLLVAPLVMISVLAGVAGAPAQAFAAGAAAAKNPANGDTAPTTQQLAAMRAQANAIQARLTAGAQRLDAARANLAALQAKAAAARAAAAKLDAELAALHTQIGHLAADLYEEPPNSVMSAVVSHTDPTSSVEATALLAYAEAQRTDLLRTVVVDGERAASLKIVAQQSGDAAATVQKTVDAQVVALQNQAATAGAQLEAAQAAYQKEQARLAAERAAALKAARDKAARDAAARRAAQLAANVATPPAECTSALADASYPAGPWGGYSDGLIPSSALCGIIGGGMLRPDAAVAFNRMSQAYATAFGGPICVTASYRPYSDQVRLFRVEPRMAAVPGTSNHGWGLAVDLGCGVQRSGSAQYEWMVHHAGAFGWVHPAWSTHSPFEPWHWEFGHLSGSGGT
jgi:hypothetical protein